METRLQFAVLLTVLFQGSLTQDNIFNAVETRPRFTVTKGNLFVRSGKGKNITFSLDGDGGIFLGDTNILTLPTMTDINSLRNKVTMAENMAQDLSDTTSGFQTQMNHFQAQINNFQRQLLQQNTTPTMLLSRLSRMDRKIGKLRKIMTENECASNPCKNAGTCIDLVEKFMCLCRPEFTDRTCSSDVNECELFTGTSRGCQNGGTCENTVGSFHCRCPPGYHGERCTTQSNTCDSSHTLCGDHGTCVASSSDTTRPYKCLCDSGYTVSTDDPSNPTCVDVNECAEGKFSCFPGVPCVNLDGSFTCGSCPIGYTGNGIHCLDIDECQQSRQDVVNDADISTLPCAPNVQCINTQGSYHCGACPPGFEGNGKECGQVSACRNRPSPCHQLATCTDAPSEPNGYKCVCPQGYNGDGIGAGGCSTDGVNACASAPCLNGGRCRPLDNNQFSCECPGTHVGRRCEHAQACSSAPCQHLGRCINLRDGNFVCLCRPSYYGQRCELEAGASNCTRSYQQSNGTLTYRALSSQTCEWTFRILPDNVLNLTFPSFDVESGRGQRYSNTSCQYDNLTLYDGVDDTAPVIGTYCGNKSDKRAPDAYLLTSSNALFMRFMSDTSRTYEGFVMTWTSTTPGKNCGGNKRVTPGVTSVITAPRTAVDQQTYDLNRRCLWIYSTEPGYRFKVSVETVRFDNGGSWNCTAGDMLKIYNGERSDDVILKQYCKTTDQATVLYSTLPYLRVYFHSDNIADPAGQGNFKLTLTAEKLLCGGPLNRSEGVIMSPNYPDQYPSNLDCLWVINGPSVGVGFVQLKFESFDVPEAIVLRRPYFERNWNVEEQAPPSFPSMLPDRRKKRRDVNLRYPKSFWRRSMIGNSRFAPLRTICPKDFVEIRDGNDELSRSIGQYCNGKEPAAVINSASTTMYIRLHSNDDTQTGRGFRASYKILCGGVVRGTEGSIETPGFPDSLGRVLHCVYTFEIPRGKVLSLNFTSFDLGDATLRGDRYASPCDENSTNYVLLKSAVPTETDRRICRLYVPSEVMVTHEKAEVIFISDGSAANKGFQARFHMLDEGCGGIYRGQSGSINSPQYPREYKPNMFCRYDIEVEQDFAIRLQFTRFNLEYSSSDCKYDNIEVYESYISPNESTGYKGRHCGVTISTIMSSGNRLVVLFKTDNSVSSEGFSAVYTAIKLSDDCSRSAFEPSGNVTSHGYPNPMTSSRTCEYHVMVGARRRILAKFTDFVINCEDGYLEVRNGPNEQSPSIAGLANARMCGTNYLRSIRTFGNRLYMRLHVRLTNAVVRDNITGPLFSMTYEELTDGCGAQLNEAAASIASPQYPDRSASKYDCTYTITVAKGNQVKLVFTTLDLAVMSGRVPLPPQYACMNEVKVTDGVSANAVVLKHFCRSYDLTTDPIISTGNSLTVRYVQYRTEREGHVGFMASYTTLCKNKLVGFNGALESPNYPRALPTARDCEWSISTTAGNRLNLMFTHFRIATAADDPECTKNYLIVVIGTKTTKYCDKKQIEFFNSENSSTVIIQFRSEAEYPGNHFRLEWATDVASSGDCGGRIGPDQSGTYISARNTSGITYVDHHVCEWIITAPPGKFVNLTVLSYAVIRQGTQGCKYDWDQIATGENTLGFFVFSGSDNTTQMPIQSTCTARNPRNPFQIFSHSNQMFVVLHYRRAYMAADEDWFTAQVVYTDGNENTCGGTMRGKQGAIHSLGYPKMMPDGSTDCSWLIEVPTNHIAVLRVLDTDMGNYLEQPDDPTCVSRGSNRQSLVQVFDGPNETYPILLYHCSRTLPENPIIRASTNQMFVKIRLETFGAPGAPLDGQPRGFAANYTTGCGAGVIASGNLQTLKLVDDFPEFEQCDWRISAQPGQRIQFVLQAFDIAQFIRGAPFICEYLKVEVFDTDALTPMNDSQVLRGCPGQSDETHTRIVLSTSNAMHVRVTNRPVYQQFRNIKFIATVSTIESGCGAELYAPRGLIQSPDYPNAYPTNMECYWTIRVAAGTRVVSTVSVLNLDPPEGSTCDSFNEFLAFQKGSISGPKVTQLCGAAQGLDVTVNGTTVIKFRSNNEQSYQLSSESEQSIARGFSLVYNQAYGGEYTVGDDEMYIESPYYDTLAEYAPAGFVDAVWRFTAAKSDHFLRATILDLQIPRYYASCIKASGLLRVFDPDENCQPEGPEGTRLCGTTLYDSCGTEIPEPINSPSNRLLVYFGSRFMFRMRGFRMKIEQVHVRNRVNDTSPGICGGNLVASSTVQTLNGPRLSTNSDEYAHNLNCRWVIQPQAMESVQIKFTAGDLEESVGLGNCRDYVTFEIVSDNGYSQSLYGFDPGTQFCKSLSRVPPQTFPGSVVVRFYTDPSVTGTPFSLEYKSVCGGIITGKRVGTLELPGQPGQRCKWIISVRENRVINYTLSGQLPANSPCIDYVETHNGPSSTQPMIERSCGILTTRDQQTTSNYLFINFVYNSSVSSRGFTLTYKEIGLSCGERLDLTLDEDSGTLLSPNYPVEYVFGADCEWMISAPGGSRIELLFTDFVLEDGDANCPYDRVDIFDGASLLSPLISRHCGTKKPSTIYSSDNHMLVRFVSDGNVQKKGFQATYSIAKCGGTIYVTGEGYVTSPGYPREYAPNQQCQWMLIAPQGYTISYSFVDMSVVSYSGGGGSTPSGSRCADYVQLCGQNCSEESYGPFCQRSPHDTLPSSITQKNSTRSFVLNVTFQTDNDVSGRGFKLWYNVTMTACGGVLSNDEGFISSPNFPEFFQANRDCVWRIKAKFGNMVTVAFFAETFDVGTYQGENYCPSGAVQVYNGPDTGSPKLAHICGTNPAQTVFTSSGPLMTVRYSTFEGKATRFTAVYHTYERAECGGLIREPTVIDLPRNETTGNYLPNKYCVWRIENPSPVNSTIWLSFTNFEMEDNNCGYDYLELIGESDVDPTFIQVQKWCGKRGNFTALYYTNALTLTFRTDAGDHFPGFSINVSFTECGGVVSAASPGAITSPNYPNSYNHDQHCSWLIVAPEGETVEVNLTDFSIEEHTDCKYDNLTLKAGPSIGSPTVATFCGKTAISRVYALLERYALVEFITDGSRHDRGFRMTYKSGKSGCGQVVHGKSGTITSPQYPLAYPAKQYCEWLLVVPSGYSVNVTFNMLDIERSENCTKDFVRIVSYPERSSVPHNVNNGVARNTETIGTYCGSSKPAILQSHTKNVHIIFQSDDNNQASGFNMTWEASCGGVYRSITGIVESPNYPGLYEPNLYCRYIIDPVEMLENGDSASNVADRYVVLEFRSMEIESSTQPAQCPHDYITVTEIRTGREVATRLCGTTTPDPISTLGPMRIELVTDGSKQYRGFSARYSVGECGATINLTEPRRVYIASPTFPAKYHDNMDCRWTMFTDPQHVIGLTFTNFSFESHDECRYDAVELWDSDSVSNDTTPMTKLCGEVMPKQMFKSNSSNLVLRMTTDASRVGGGFMATAMRTQGSAHGCGGYVTVTENRGQLKSPVTDKNNANSTYENYLSCVWRLIASRGFLVQLTVDFFELEDVHNGQCQYDYVQIWDGPKDSSPVLQKLCGKIQGSMKMASTQGEMNIEFVTDGSVTLRGFTFNYIAETVKCGGEQVATSTVQYLAPGRDILNPNMLCTYFINAPPGERIQLKVERLGLPSQQCRSNYVEFRDDLIMDGTSRKECSANPSYPFRTTTNNARVTIATGADYVAGFVNVSYVILNQCNVTVDMTDSGNTGGRLTSPNYPLAYDENNICTYQITASENYRIQLYFVELHLELSDDCAYDSLQYFEGNEPNANKYCGDVRPPDYISQTNKVTVQLKSDTSVAGRGFDLTYVASTGICGGVISAPSGVLANNGSDSCQWIVQVSLEKAVKVEFISFGSLQCERDSGSVTISEDNVRSETYECDSSDAEGGPGADASAPYVATSNVLTISSLLATFRLRFNETALPQTTRP